MGDFEKVKVLIAKLNDIPVLRITDLRKGQTVYEFGRCIPMAKLLVTSDPERIETQKGYANGWRCMTTDIDGNPVTLFASDKGMYPPRLYDRDYGAT